MDTDNKKCKVHIFVCVNKRSVERACCSKTGSEEIFCNLKSWSKENFKDVWVSKSGCLGFCSSEGATIVVYPKGIWFTKVKLENLDEIKKTIVEGNQI